MHSYERLIAWQKCHALTLAIYKSTNGWPASERYGLVSQVRRAAYSATANIAEGATKRGTGDYRRLLDVALGSLAEVAYCLRLASDLCITQRDGQELERIRSEAAATTWGLYKSISRKRDETDREYR